MQPNFTQFDGNVHNWDGLMYHITSLTIHTLGMTQKTFRCHCTPSLSFYACWLMVACWHKVLIRPQTLCIDKCYNKRWPGARHKIRPLPLLCNPLSLHSLIAICLGQTTEKHLCWNRKKKSGQTFWGGSRFSGTFKGSQGHQTWHAAAEQIIWWQMAKCLYHDSHKCQPLDSEWIFLKMASQSQSSVKVTKRRQQNSW